MTFDLGLGRSVECLLRFLGRVIVLVLREGGWWKVCVSLKSLTARSPHSRLKSTLRKRTGEEEEKLPCNRGCFSFTSSFKIFHHDTEPGTDLQTERPRTEVIFPRLVPLSIDSFTVYKGQTYQDFHPLYDYHNGILLPLDVASYPSIFRELRTPPRVSRCPQQESGNALIWCTLTTVSGFPLLPKISL